VVQPAAQRTSAEGHPGMDHGMGHNDCTCPPYAVKSTCGKRSNMEDTYALFPNICELPMSPMVTECADKFPQRIAMQLHPSTLMPHSSSATVSIGHATVSTASISKKSAPAAVGGQRGEGATPDVEESAGSLSSADSGTVEKLHFFGVYDGHGGIEASQHCAQRLHHHLSRALTNVGTVWYESNQFLCPTESDANGAVWDDGEVGLCRDPPSCVALSPGMVISSVVSSSQISHSKHGLWSSARSS
jgi:hypothetical protein